MSNFQPTGIQLHLTTGNKRMFYQEDAELVAKICSDLDGQIFSRANLVIESLEGVTSFPGSALIGITILTDPLPTSFFEREAFSKINVRQISQESFLVKRPQVLSSVEGTRGLTLSDLEFISGEHIFLEMSAVAVSGMRERDALHHLFSNPSLCCRRLDGGFSIWNTAHIVSWAHYPKLEVPANAWAAESLAEAVPGQAKVLHLS